MNFDIFESICNRTIEFIDLPVTVRQTDDISGAQIILEKTAWTASMTPEGVMNKKKVLKSEDLVYHHQLFFFFLRNDH